MDRKNKYFPELNFGGFTRADVVIAFYLRVNSLIAPSHIVLDVGCGRGVCASDPLAIRKDLCVLRGKCKKVVGMDLDPSAETNPNIDEFRLVRQDEPWPIENDSIDVCVSDSAIEHFSNPDFFFSECARVIKPGGYLCLKTPNLLSYFGIASKLIPNKFHAKLLGKIQEVKPYRLEEDVFPTLYKCNTKGKIEKMLAQHGFDGIVYGHDGEPSYLSFSGISYFAGILWQKYAPDSLRVTLFAFAKKKTDR